MSAKPDGSRARGGGASPDWSQLPDAALASVLRHLPERWACDAKGVFVLRHRGPAVERVCRAWRAAALEAASARMVEMQAEVPHSWLGSGNKKHAEGKAMAAERQAAGVLGARRLRTLTVTVSSGDVPLPAPGILAAAVFPHLHRLHLGGGALLAFSSLLPRCSQLRELCLDLRQAEHSQLRLLAFHLCTLPSGLHLLHLHLPGGAPLTGTSLAAAVRQHVQPGELLLRGSPQPLPALGAACQLARLRACSIAVRSDADAAGLAHALDAAQLHGCTALTLAEERRKLHGTMYRHGEGPPYHLLYNLTPAQVIVSLPGLERMPRLQRLRVSGMMPRQVWSCAGLTSLLLTAAPHKALLQLPVPAAAAAATHAPQATVAQQPAAAASTTVQQAAAPPAEPAAAVTAPPEGKAAAAAKQPAWAPGEQPVPASTEEQAAAEAKQPAAPAAHQPAAATAEQPAAAAAAAQPAALACLRLARLGLQGFSFQGDCCFPAALCCALTGLTHLALIDCCPLEEAKRRRAFAGSAWYPRQALPPEVSRLRSLRQLTISGTRLAGLEPLLSLTSLTALHVPACDLLWLPDGPYLQHLASLDIALNSFGQPLPFAVAAATALRQLRFDCYADGVDACGVGLEDWHELQAKLCSLHRLETLCVEMGDDKDSEAVLQIVQRGVNCTLVGRGGGPSGLHVPSWWGGAEDRPTLSESEDDEAEAEQQAAAQAAAQLRRGQARRRAAG